MAGNQDYIEFLSEFVNGLNIPDQLPVPVSSYNIDDDELVGDFVHWLLQYFGQKHCPLGLVAPLVRSVVEEMLNYCKTDPEAHSLRDPSGQYSQLRLMQACTARANALCVRLHQDPAVLIHRLPPPPTHLVPVAAHGARSNQRRGMEDRHVVVHDFNAVFNVQDDTPASYYAVFDGHAGQDAAVFSAAHVHQFLAESVHYPADPVAALKDAILRTDKYYLKKVKLESRYQSGTTALCSLLRGRMLHVAWVGDSQALLVRNGRAEMLVDPHKPKRPDEERRIIELGGVVLFHGMWRVNGQLAVSRAIGDPNFKPYVSAEAEVRSVALQGDEELLIMASDGLLDFVTPQQAASAAFQQLQDNPDNINAVCSRLINLAKKQGSTDDISVIVAFLTDPHELAKRPIPSAMDMDTEDLVDTTPNHHNNMNGSNNQWSNPFHLESQDSASKKALNLGELNFEPTPVKQNGNSDHGAGFNNHQDLFDLGPETDVDRIDESDDDETGSQDGAGGHNPFTCGVDDEEVELRRIQQQQPEFDIARHPREETPTPPADHVPESDQLVQDNIPGAADVDNVADSGDESEEEWKYFSVEPSKQAPQSFDLLQNQESEKESGKQDAESSEVKEEEKNQPLEEILQSTAQLLLPSQPESQPETEVVDDNMDSQLNPNAAEFVPVSPTRETCVLPGETQFSPMVEQPPVIDPFQTDMPAPESIKRQQEGFEIHPVDDIDIFSDDIEGEKENLVIQATEQDLSAAPPSEDHFGQSPMFGGDSANIEQVATNYMDFCGTVAHETSGLSPLDEQTGQDEGISFEGNFDFDQKLNEAAPLSPVHNMMSPIKSEPDEDMFSQELAQEERMDVLVETPNFSVAQGPTFPVMENIMTPDEDSVASATSPSHEEIPTCSELQAPVLDEVLSSPHAPADMSFSPNALSPQPEAIASPMSPKHVSFPSEPEIESFISPMVDLDTPSSPLQEVPPLASPLQEVPPPASALQEAHPPTSPFQDDIPRDMLPPISSFDELQMPAHIQLSEEPVMDTTATPPPTPAMHTEASFENTEKTVEEFDPLSQVIEKLSIASPVEPTVETQIEPIIKMEPVIAAVVKTPELEIKMESEMNKENVPLPETQVESEIKVEAAVEAETKTQEVVQEAESATKAVAAMAAVAAAGAAGAVAAAGAASAVAAAKLSKPTSPTKADSKKATSPIKDKPSLASKKAPAAAPSKAPVKAAVTAKAPALSKTSTATKPATTKSPSAPKPGATTTAARKPLPSATLTTAKPKPAPSTATTRAPRPAATGTSSPLKPTSATARPKPASSTAAKPADAKKPLVNGDATKAAPKRPISASTTAARPAPRTATTAPKPATSATTKLSTTSTATKTPPRPRPASAAVNGVSKTTAASKSASPRPASATTAAAPAKRTTTTTRTTTTSASTKQVKETANKQISATRTTASKTAPPTKTTAKTAATATGKIPPIKKPAPKTATKVATKDTPTKVEENLTEVHVNGNSHPAVENGKVEIEEEALFRENPPPCLVAVDGVPE